MKAVNRKTLIFPRHERIEYTEQALVFIYRGTGDRGNQIMSIISVAGLKKLYGDLVAVDGISFNIEKGQIFGLLGPNGACKTTTINMLTGLARPTAGKIFIDGIDGIKNIKKVQGIIGIVPDESNLYDEMDGFDNLCFCASLYGIRKSDREKRANELLGLFGLKDAGKRPYRAYSKGMRRKLTIAAGIIHNPKILFLDEPTTGIDVESARQIRSLIVDMKRQGTTVFLTTHYIEEAERLCDRIAFIVNGKIVKSGSIDKLMENAGHEHTIRLTLDGSVKELRAEFQRNFPNSGLNRAKVVHAQYHPVNGLYFYRLCNILTAKEFLYLRPGKFVHLWRMCL